MAHPQIAVFARLAEGGAKATRTIEGQSTLLGRTMHAIDYDAIHDEIVVTQQFGQAVLTFRGGADGEEPPIRVIQGSQTQLVAPDRLAVDPVNNEIYVPEDDKLLVFDRLANGNVAPKRILAGADASAVAIDTDNDILVVLTSQFRGNTEVKLFDRTAQGRATPIGVISGPKTLLTSTRNVRVHNGWILVAHDGMQLPDGNDAENPMSFVAIYSTKDRGDVAPRWTLGGPDGRLRKPRGVDLDVENKQVIVSDKFLNAVAVFSLPEIFE